MGGGGERRGQNLKKKNVSAAILNVSLSSQKELQINVFMIFAVVYRDNAKNKVELKRIGITHVVNCAKGTAPGMIDTSASYFKDVAIQFLGLQAKDVVLYDISKHFQKAVNFIDEALGKGGKNSILIEGSPD